MSEIKTFQEVIDYSESTGVTIFFSKLFESRDVAHLNHLGTKSFAEHMALNSYYEEIIPLVDSLIESYQGCYGLIEISIGSSGKQDSVAYFTSLKDYIFENKEKYFKDTFLLNQIDTIIQLISSTIYKLKYLK